MSRTIPHRELRNNSSAILRQAEAGEVFEVTNHGKVVAKLVPPDWEGSALVLRPALVPLDVARLSAIQTGAEPSLPLSQALQESREDRF